MNINFNNNTLQIQKFDMNNLLFDSKGEKIHPKIAIVGKNQTGKSWLIRDIMYIIQKIESGIVITPDENHFKFYSESIPSSNIHVGYNKDILTKFLLKQDLELDINIGDNRKYVVFDDCINSLYDILNDGNIINIYLCGKHYQFTFIYSTHNHNTIPLQYKNQFDYIFLFKEHSLFTKKKIYKNFGKGIPSYNVFNQIFTQITHNYDCMVIKKKSNKKWSFSNNIYWHRSKKRKDFKVGIDDNINTKSLLESYKINTEDDTEDDCITNNEYHDTDYDDNMRVFHMTNN